MSLEWSRERYVRAFTRDTPSWLLASWEARSFLLLLLRKLDRNGCLDLGEDMWDGLAATVMMPVEVVEPAAAYWLKRKTMIIEGTVLTMPKFIEAQECVASDALRAQQYRERKSVTKRDDESRNVTERHETLPIVTENHEPSRNVTERHSVPSVPCLPYRAVPNPPEGESARTVVDVAVPPPAPSGVQRVAAPTPDGFPPSPITPELVEACKIDSYPVPTDQDWRECVTYYRSEGSPIVSPFDTLRRWMGNKKRFQASARARGSPPRRGGGPVQPMAALPDVKPAEVSEEELQRMGM